MDWTDLASRGLHIADIPGAAIRSLLVGQVPYFNLTDNEGRVSGEDVLEYWGGPRNSYLGTGIEMLTGAVGDVGGALALRSLLKGLPAARLVMEAMPRGPRRSGMVINPFSYVGGEAEAGKNALMRGDVAIRPSTVVGKETLGKTDAMKLAKAVDTPEERALRIEAIIDNMKNNPPVDPSDLVGPDGWAAWVNSVPSKAAKEVADKMAAKAAAAKEVQASLADSQLANILAGKPSPSVRGGVRASAAAQASSDAEADLAELLTGRRMLKRRDFGPISPEAAMAEFPPASARRGSLADFVRKPALTSPGGSPDAGMLVEPLRLPAPATTSRNFAAEIGPALRTPRYDPLRLLLGEESASATVRPTSVDSLLRSAPAVTVVREPRGVRMAAIVRRHPFAFGLGGSLAGTLGAAGIASLLQGDGDEEPATPVSQEPALDVSPSLPVIRQEPKSSSLRMPRLPQPEVLVETPRIQFGSRKWFGAPPAPEAQPASPGGGRMFTDRAGRQLHGEILETTPDAALFRRSRDGKLAWIARGNLSEADQAELE